MSLSDLLEKFRSYSPSVDAGVLEKAYEFSKHMHRDQQRASGEHYFTHCEAVAETLLEFKLDLPTVAAGLLHDVVEDTPVTAEDLKAEFGEEIARLVQGVTKLDALQFSSQDHFQSENYYTYTKYTYTNPEHHLP